jgi:hypothetical protein
MTSGKKHHNEYGEEIYGYLLNCKLMAAAFFDNRLQNETRSTLGLLVSYAYADGMITHFSIKKTALKRDVKRWAIQNQIKKLIEYGYLQKESDGGHGQTNRYRLLYDNYYRGEGVTQLDNTPSVTQLGYTDVIPRDDTSVIPSDYPKKTIENTEIKKEKNTHPRDGFLEEVKEEIDSHGFQEIGNFSEGVIIDQAKACWERWSATGEFPNGNRIDAFKGWLRTGLRDGKIKEASREQQEQSIRQEIVVENLEPWQRDVIDRFGQAVYSAWFGDGVLQDGILSAATRFKAGWIEKEYGDDLRAIFGKELRIEVLKQEKNNSHPERTYEYEQ